MWFSDHLRTGLRRSFSYGHFEKLNIEVTIHLGLDSLVVGDVSVILNV